MEEILLVLAKSTKFINRAEYRMITLSICRRWNTRRRRQVLGPATNIRGEWTFNQTSKKRNDLTAIIEPRMLTSKKTKKNPRERKSGKNYTLFGLMRFETEV